MKSQLIPRTIALLRERPHYMSLRHISEQTGVPEGWIKRFAGRHIGEPSCLRVEALYEFLSPEPLFTDDGENAQ